MPLKKFIFALLTVFALGLPGSVRAEFSAPINSTDDYRHFLSRIPAPRGLIVDRTGKTLAVSKSGKRIAIRLLTVEAGSGEKDLTEAVDDLASALSIICPSVGTPDPELVRQHFKNRPYIPFPISRVLPETEAAALAGLNENGADAIEIQDVITREYPAGVVTSHLVGFVGEAMPDQHSPYGNEEYRWPPFEGRRGLEESFDTELRGKDGLLSLLYDHKGREINREILVAPVPGQTLVASVDLGMQELAMRTLEKSGHYGAFVAVDSESGDILALASYPGFDPNEYVFDAPIDNREVMLGGVEGILGEWGTETPGLQYLGRIPSGYALVAGKNAATVRLGFQTGLEKVKVIARQAGINSELPDFPSAFLGAGEVSLLELTHAYTTFPNKGRRTSRAGLIDRITSREGEVIYERSSADAPAERAFSERTATQIRILLSQAVHERADSETSPQLASLGANVGGMTGTSSNSDNNWFVGFNDRYTWGVWVVMDGPRTIYENAFARDTALPIWSQLAVSLVPPETVAEGEHDLEIVPVCVDSCSLAHVGCRERGQ